MAKHRYVIVRIVARYYRDGQDVWIDGELLTPYRGTYGQASVTSNNCPRE